MNERPTVPCKWCETPTVFLGTGLCDQCWLLDRNIRARPDVAKKILAHYVEQRAQQKQK